VLTAAEQTRKHKVADSGSSLYPWLIVPAPHLGFVYVKGSQSPGLAKRLEGWVRACSLVGNGVIQESRRRNKDPLNMQVT
jgi:hypothetical protein